MTRLGAALIAVALVAAAASAAAVSIAAIIDAPESYLGQQVTVVGTVTAPTAAKGNETLYTLTGDDRRITVIGKGSAPTPGDRLEVTAKVGWRHGDDEFTWPPILFETARRPAP